MYTIIIHFHIITLLLKSFKLKINLLNGFEVDQIMIERARKTKKSTRKSRNMIFYTFFFLFDGASGGYGGCHFHFTFRVYLRTKRKREKKLCKR